MTSMPAAIVALGLAVLALLGGCRSSSNAELRAAVADGVSELSGSWNGERLRDRLRQTIARVRSVHVPADDDRAQRLALRGFTAMLQGVESRIAFARNDSGNIEAATRDARRADRWFKAGAALLRAAGRELGVDVGRLKGY
jgi:hypothetical protein